MALHTMKSVVRGGGVVGSGAWVARLTGLGGQFTFEREFIPKDRHLSGSGRSGVIYFELDEPGVYEYRCIGSNENSIARQRWAGGEKGFFRLHEDGTVEEISRSEAKSILKGA